jgi:hypothetical protein
MEKSEILREQLMKENMEKSGYDADDIEAALTAFGVTKSLIPLSYDHISSSKQCIFCKGEQKGVKYRYASTMLAHKEPLTKKAGLFGIGRKKVTSSIGSILPVNIPICKRCRMVHFIANSIKAVVFAIVMILAVMGAALFVGDNQGLEMQILLKWSIVIVGGVIGFLAGKLIAKAYTDKASVNVHMNIFEISPLDEMKEKGWFTLSDDKYVTPYSFVKKFDVFGKIFDENV